MIFVRGQRWGDAPVHTIAASLFAGKDEIHFFREVGYEHYAFVHCPQGEMWERGRCSREQERNFGTSRARGRAAMARRRSSSFLYRLSDGVVMLAEVGGGEGHPSSPVTTVDTVSRSEDVACKSQLFSWRHRVPALANFACSFFFFLDRKSVV